MRSIKKIKYELWVSVLFLLFFIITVVRIMGSVLFPTIGRGAVFAAVYFALPLVPVILFLCAFILRKKEEGKTRKVARILILVAAFAAMAVEAGAYYWSSGGWAEPGINVSPFISSTDKTENYLRLDDGVAALKDVWWENNEFGIFPKEVPADTSDFQYTYRYAPGLTGTFTRVRVTWAPDADTFKSEKERVSVLPYVSVYKNGTHTLYYDSNCLPESCKPITTEAPVCYADFDTAAGTIVYTVSCEGD